jgi:hypothetical protein
MPDHRCALGGEVEMIEGRSQCQRCGKWFKTGAELRAHIENCRPQVGVPRRRAEQARFGTFAEAYRDAVDREVER